MIFDEFDVTFFCHWLGIDLLHVPRSSINIVFCRAFDHNGDGTISKEELKEAMQRFGHSFTEDECDEMFLQV